MTAIDRDTARVMKLLERGANIIAEADTLDAALVLRAEVAAIEAIVRKRDMGRATERKATSLRLRTERRLGQIIEVERAAGRMPGHGGDRRSTSATSRLNVEDYGLTWNEAADYKRLAALNDELFEAALADLQTISRRSLVNQAEALLRGRTPPGDRTPRHPARFSATVQSTMTEALEGCRRVLDPFAGTGLIHVIAAAAGTESVGIELEPEWADRHPDTQVGSALDLPFRDASFDAVATSPTYGNRLADHHTPTDLHSHRRSYQFDLGRDLHPDNSGTLQWGDEYRAFHEQAWKEAVRVLQPGGRFVLNISDHIRAGKRQHVSGWHVVALQQLGLTVTDVVPVPTSRLRDGENAEARVDYELVITFALDR